MINIFTWLMPNDCTEMKENWKRNGRKWERGRERENEKKNCWLILDSFVIIVQQRDRPIFHGHVIVVFWRHMQKRNKCSFSKFFQRVFFSSRSVLFFLSFSFNFLCYEKKKKFMYVTMAYSHIHVETHRKEHEGSTREVSDSFFFSSFLPFSLLPFPFFTKDCNK